MSKVLRIMDQVAVGVSPGAGSPGIGGSDGGAQLVGLADMAGCWRSCDEKNAGVPAIDVSLADRAVRARVFGSGPELSDRWVDWGAVNPGALLSDGPSSAQTAGFTVDFSFGSTQAQLQINFKIGVAVAGVFVRGIDAAGHKRALFWREFLARSPSITRPVQALAGFGPQSLIQPESLSHRLLAEAARDFDTSSIEGRWMNTHPGSRGIPEMFIERRGDGMVLRMWGRGEGGDLEDWGEAACEIYGAIEEDHQPSACALATFSFDFLDCDVQVRQNKGVLAVTTFNRFKGGSDRFDYVTRELYYRVEASS